MSLKESPVSESYLADLVDPVTPIGSLIDWTQFANCKGKTKLFFAPKAERPQARERREPQKQNRYAQDAPFKRCAKNSHATTTSTDCGAARTKKSATLLVTRWPHQLEFAAER